MTEIKIGMAPAAIAKAIHATYQTSAMEVALEVVRLVSRQQALDSAVSMYAQKLAEQATRVRPNTCAGIMAAVCAHFGITEDELVSSTRARRVSAPRQMCWVLLRERLHLSCMEVADRFDRDHSTILIGCKQVDRDSDAWIEINRRLDAAMGVEVVEAAE